MFTGIVQGVATLLDVSTNGDIVALRLDFPMGALDGVSIGGSISINGCCLTVVAFEGRCCTFELVQESLKRTTFSSLKPGAVLHYERSLKIGDELGGHILSGHIDTTGKVSRISKLKGSINMEFEIPSRWIKYVLPKGYISVMGTSLTVVEVDPKQACFGVSLIPETLRVTMFESLLVGDEVNIEIDRSTQVIVDTVERVLKNPPLP
jgi:riboflavin synthase